MTLALPSTREEAWRWSSLGDLPTLADAKPEHAYNRELSELWLGCGGPRLVFLDGVYDAERSDPGPVAIGPVDARSDHPLASLATGNGWTLALGPEHAPENPVEIVHMATGAASHLPATIALAEDAQASIVESFAGDGWANRLTRIALGKGARLMRSLRLVQDSGFVSLREEAEIGAGASLVTIALGAGRAGSRIDGALTLTGEGAYAEIGGTLLARGEQRQEAAVVVRHAVPGGTSRQIWRAVADDTAAASIAARVEVARDAQKTDGEQSLRGLLLKRAATVNLKPELEIFADDVKCAHGATVGELDRAALFYLESRGIPPAEARALLTRAFLADAIDRIGETAVREAFAKDADEWLGGVA